MKKNYVLIALFVLIGWSAKSQIINQSAAWPNAAWTVTGSYSTDPLAYEANPTTTANFAFDDDDAGTAHEDNIAAESPVIDLTAAFNAGETNLIVTVDYGYRYLANDQLSLEYWNADNSVWQAWGDNIPGNSTTVNNDFCTIPKTTYVSSNLDIAGFSAAQLSGFRYRIAYDDDPNGPDYNYGFCFDSPVITSLSCPLPQGLVASAVTSEGATLNWDTSAGTTGYQYVLDTNPANPTSGTTISATTYEATDLTPQTTYYFHLSSSCGASSSDWVSVSFTTAAVPPANDNCAQAIALTVNPDFNCTVTTPGTLAGATDSGVTDNGAGTPNDDVWFRFVATGTTHLITIGDITGTPADLVHEVLSGDCGSLASVSISDPNNSTVNGLTPGNTYYVRVFSYGSAAAATTNFTVCVKSIPAAPANDNCSGAVALTLNTDLNCTATTSGTLAGATDSGVTDNGAGTPNDDVWYSFVATGTTHLITIGDVTGSPTDLVHEVFSGSCGSLTSILISDPNNSTVTGLTPGNTYYVRVFSYGSAAAATTNFTVCVKSLPAAPANDNCSGAIALTVNPDLNCTVTSPGTLAGATDSGVADTGAGTPNDDVWYRFVATGTTHLITIGGVTGSPTDLVHEVFSGACGSLTSLLISDPNNSTVNGLTPGNTYYVRVFSYGSAAAATTNFTVCVKSLPAPPANDDCSGSIALTVNADADCAVTTNGTLAGATDSGVADNGAGTPNDDVWYSFVATSSSHIVTLSNITNTPTDLVHEVFSGSCGTLTSLSVSDPNSSTITGLTIGNTYYVRVFSYSGSVVASTNFTICVGTPPNPPANDECSGAVTLVVDSAFCTGSNTNGTNAGATDSGVANASCFNYGQNDVWFKFVVPATTASVDVSTDFTGGTLVDTEVALYSGACGSLNELDCDQDGGTTTLSNGFSYNSLILDSPVTAGETYYVRVSGYSSTAIGSFCLQISTNEELSAADLAVNKLKAYPNPVKDMLAIENADVISEVSVFNLLGQSVMAKTVDATQAQLDLSSLAQGTYLVKVASANGTKTIKIVKE